jgi:hypothetical protein
MAPTPLRTMHMSSRDNVSAWTDVMILKLFLPKNLAKKFAFLTQNKGNF